MKTNDQLIKENIERFEPKLIESSEYVDTSLQTLANSSAILEKSQKFLKSLKKQYKIVKS